MNIQKCKVNTTFENQSNSPYSNKGEKRWIISRNEKPFMYKFSANYIYKKKKRVSLYSVYTSTANIIYYGL